MSEKVEFSAAVDFFVNGANICCDVISDFYSAATSLDKVAYWDAVMEEYKVATGGSFFVTYKQIRQLF